MTFLDIFSDSKLFPFSLIVYGQEKRRDGVKEDLMPPFRVCSIYDSFVERIFVLMCISKFYVFCIFKVSVRLYDFSVSVCVFTFLSN